MVIVQKCPGGSRNRMCEQSEQILLAFRLVCIHYKTIRPKDGWSLFRSAPAAAATGCANKVSK
jgi:hypothetical protein